MKSNLLIIAIAAMMAVSCNSNSDLKKRVEAVENRLELKNLVDTFSVLADVKDTNTQGLLFTEDGSMKTVANGQVVFSIDGRQNIVNACAGYLALFETVWHSNGQQTVELIDAENATGVSYCTVILIGKNQMTGKTERLTEGFRYHDTYTKKNGTWQIAVRESEVLWAKTETIE